MAEVGARDRLVMGGLVVPGLLSVVAGVLSGRSTINYVLARDAREAALSWTGEIDTRFSQQGAPAPKVLGKDLKVLDAGRLRQDFAPQGDQDRPLLRRYARKEPADQLRPGAGLLLRQARTRRRRD